HRLERRSAVALEGSEPSSRWRALPLVALVLFGVKSLAHLEGVIDELPSVATAGRAASPLDGREHLDVGSQQVLSVGHRSEGLVNLFGGFVEELSAEKLGHGRAERFRNGVERLSAWPFV